MNTYKKIISTMIILMIIVQMFMLNISSVNAVEKSNVEKIVEIAKNEIGYFETTYSDGSFYSKYGDWYGYPNQPWCAMFVSWCANQAGISSNVIPKFSSCNKGREWFANKDLWRTKDNYSPKAGDIVFLNNCTHVGIVEKYDDGIVYTIEGNASDENGENFGVRQRIYSLSSEKITGFGIPDLNILSTFNGVATKKSPAYMLPDNTSQTVWEVWQDDELEVLCSVGNYYLVMYPFLNTGKFVCAYVEKSAVNISGDIPTSEEFFYIDKKGITLGQTNLYHNPSNSSLLSNSGEDKRIRSVLSENINVNVLFERDGYYFVESNGITGFANSDNIEFDIKETVANKINIGDVNFDGIINILDATIIQKYVVELVSFNADQFICADVDGSNEINIIDATLVQKHIAELISDFPVNGQGTTKPPLETIPTTISHNINIESINLPNSFNVYLNEEKTLKYTFSPQNANKKNIYWLSADESIASITSDGVITGNSLGTTKIIAFTTNGVRSECSVTVCKRNIEAQSITIDNTNPNILNNGDTFKLNATVYPADTTDKSVVWSSSNPDVASVDGNGLVTAKTAGTVTITANCVNTAINATATIRVNQITSYIGSGNFCLKLKGTNSYLDHQGGNSNGTNVHLWSGDGTSNENQKIKIERIDDNRHLLRSAVNNDLLIDVNRGNSYSDPISIGKNIDLWVNNDWQAQEWLFTKTYDGYYIIRLNMYQGGAIEASGKNNGDNIFFGTYNPENDMQKWELVNTKLVPVPESDGWVYNTQDIGNVNVRSGPGTNYPSIGGFNEGQQITVIGSLNGDWYKVRGANRHDGSTITGYCHKDYISTPYPPDPDNPAPNLYSNSYNKTVNPFAQSNLYGQCTWYSWGRANEVKGTKLPCRGDAKSWYSVAANNGYSVGSTPRKNSIAVWSNGTYGHVAYVEKVSGNNVTITESNWDRVTYDYQYSIEKGIYYYSGYKTLTVSQMNSRCGTLLGYIYL